jgi:hypothetical protein
VALDALKPGEKHDAYRILELRVVTSRDDASKVSGVFEEGFGVCGWKSQSTLTFHPANLWVTFNVRSEREQPRLSLFTAFCSEVDPERIVGA